MAELKSLLGDESVLGAQIRQPCEYVERRIERFNLPAWDVWHWDISVQIRLPMASTSGSHRFLVSLGLYAKERLPDLEVRNADGTLLPIASRRVRGFGIAGAVLAPYYEQVVFQHRWVTTNALWAQFSLEQNDENFPLTEAESALLRCKERLEYHVALIATSPPKTAKRLVAELQDWLSKPYYAGGWPEILQPITIGESGTEECVSFQLIEQVRSFVDTTHIVTEVAAQPGSRILLNLKYTDGGNPDREWRNLASLRSRSSHATDAGSGQTGSNGAGTNRKPGKIATAASSLGLTPFVFPRLALNADHCQSFYQIALPPPGIEIVRSYWYDSERKHDAAPADANGRQDKSSFEGNYLPVTAGHSAVLAMHDDDAGVDFPAASVYEFQAAKHGWARIGWLQLLGAWLLALAIWLQVIDGGSRNITSVFALSGGLLSASAIVANTFSARVSTYVRRSLGLAGLLPIGYAVGFSVEPSRLPFVGGWPLLQLYNSVAASILTLFVVVLGYLVWGNRTPAIDELDQTVPGRATDAANLALEDIRRQRDWVENRAGVWLAVGVALSMVVLVTLNIWTP